MVGNRTIWYRGRRLLDAMLANLLNVQGMRGATDLLYAGCSAGGLTTYLHADYVAQMVGATVRVRALADAMFSVEHNSISGAPSFPARMQWGFGAWNASASVDAPHSNLPPKYTRRATEITGFGYR